MRRPRTRRWRFIVAATLAAMTVAAGTTGVALADVGRPTGPIGPLPTAPSTCRIPVPAIEASTDPTCGPTGDPTGTPTEWPTGSPTQPPTGSPTQPPTGSPTWSPTQPPTGSPTPSPSPSDPPPGCVDNPGTPPSYPPIDDLTPPYGSNGGPFSEQAQDVGGRLLGVIRANNYFGFAGVVADAPGNRLLLHWLAGVGLPGPVQAIVDSPGQPIQVVRMDASYTEELLQSRAEFVLNDSPALSAQICGLLHTVTVLEEGTGLIAGVQPYDSTVDPVSFASQAQLVLMVAAGVPVTVQLEDPPVQATRVADTAPFIAGTRRTNAAATTGCSNGFAIKRRVDNKEYLLSAAHCGRPAEQVWNGAPLGNPGRVQIGTVRDFVPGLDSELVEPTGALFGLTYGGGVNDATEAIYIVSDTGVNIKGLFMWVCASGGRTGENCGLQITATKVSYLNFTLSLWQRNLQITTDQVTAVSVFNGLLGFKAPALGLGDSGGPVIMHGPALGPRAVGTITSGQHVTPCRVRYPADMCFSKLYYTDINALNRHYVFDLR